VWCLKDVAVRRRELESRLREIDTEVRVRGCSLQCSHTLVDAQG
jgi:hypothetical protein